MKHILIVIFFFLFASINGQVNYTKLFESKTVWSYCLKNERMAFSLKDTITLYRQILDDKGAKCKNSTEVFWSFINSNNFEQHWQSKKNENFNKFNFKIKYNKNLDKYLMKIKPDKEKFNYTYSIIKIITQQDGLIDTIILAPVNP